MRADGAPPRDPTAHDVEVYTSLIPRDLVQPGSVLGVTVLWPRPFFLDAGLVMWPGTCFLLGPGRSQPPSAKLRTPWGYGAGVYLFGGMSALRAHPWTPRLEVDLRVAGGYAQLFQGDVPQGRLDGLLVAYGDVQVAYQVAPCLGLGLRLRGGAQLVLAAGGITAPLFEDMLVVWW